MGIIRETVRELTGKGFDNYNEIKKLYLKYSIKKRYRLDNRKGYEGLWIFPLMRRTDYRNRTTGGIMLPTGIFINKDDYIENKNFYLINFLPEVDDELRKKISGY